MLEALLGTTDRVVQEIDSVEYGLTDIQEYYANTGAVCCLQQKLMACFASSMPAYMAPYMSAIALWGEHPHSSLLSVYKSWFQLHYVCIGVRYHVLLVGALKKAAENARKDGKSVGCSIVETFGKNAAPQELSDVLRLEYRSKLLNPKWAKVSNCAVQQLWGITCCLQLSLLLQQLCPFCVACDGHSID